MTKATDGTPALTEMVAIEMVATEMMATMETVAITIGNLAAVTNRV
jgi:hypothetical protein